MAIEPVEKRIDSITPRRVTSRAPGIEVSYLETTPVTEMPPGSTPADALDSEARTIVGEDRPEAIDEADPVTLSTTDQVLVAGVGVTGLFSKKVKSLGKKGALDQQPSIPTPKDPAPGSVSPESLKETERALERFEQAIDEAPVTGKPPDVPINLDRIDGPDDFKQSVSALAQSIGLKDYSLSFEQTIAQLKNRGFNTDSFKDLAEFKQQYGEIPADMLEMRLAKYANHKRVYEAGRKAYANPDTPELQADLLYLINKQAALNDSYRLVRARAAQGTAVGRLQITEGMAEQYIEKIGDVKLPAANSDEFKAMLADPETNANLKALIQKYVQLEDEMSQDALIDSVSKVGLVGDLIDRTWKNGLLTASGTHLVNLTGNTTFLASTIVTRQLAGVISAIKRGAGGQGEVEMGEAAAMVAGMVHSSRDALTLAAKAFRTGTTREMRAGYDLTSDAGKRYEGQYQIFNAKDYGVENETLVKGINGWANFVTLIGGRPIMAMDEFFKTVGYRAELYAQAYRAQIKTRRQVLAKTKDANKAEAAGLKALEDALQNPSTEVTEAAKDFSHMITYSKKLEGNAALVQQLAENTLVGKITFPFVKSPIWMGSESLQHSALAPLSSQWRKDIAAGGAKRELAIAKFGMGATLMTGVGSLVADGRITGGGPGNTALRQQYLASGWRPYSFVFKKEEWDEDFIDFLKDKGLDPSIGPSGALYVPYRGIEPIAGPMAMIADAVEFGRYEDDSDLTGQMIIGATFGLYNFIGQQPVMSALTSIAGSFTATIPNPKMAFRNAIDQVFKQGASYVGNGLVPFQSARGQVARSLDPVRRDISGDPYLPTGVKGLDEFRNQTFANTPGLSKDLPAVYDYFGRAEYRGDPENPWTSAASGIRYSRDKQSQADKVWQALEIGPAAPSRAVDVSVPGEDGSVNVKLMPAEAQEWRRNMAFVLGPALVRNKETGVYENKMVNVQDAIVAAADEPDFMYLTKDIQQSVIKEIYNNYKQAAKEKLIMENPPIMERAMDAIEKRKIRGIAP
jgi:tryptophan 2,3-dioxygenase